MRINLIIFLDKYIDFRFYSVRLRLKSPFKFMSFNIHLFFFFFLLSPMAWALVIFIVLPLKFLFEGVRERSKNLITISQAQLSKTEPNIREPDNKVRELHLAHITNARRRLGFRTWIYNRIQWCPTQMTWVGCECQNLEFI